VTIFRPRTWLPREEIVTGERLQALADVSVVPRHVRDFHQHLERYTSDPVLLESYDDIAERDIERLSAAQRLFVYTHELRPFIEHIWPRLEGDGYVLITHNSDYEADDSYLPWLEGTGAKLTRWFAQNVMVRHPKLEPLPIAVANSMWKHGNLRTFERAIARAEKRPKDRLVFLHFNPGTHAPRKKVWETLRSSFPDLPPAPPPGRRFRSYLDDLARYRFCVSPRGNGIDSHRVWECLYLGVVPVVERSTHTELWEERGVPLLAIDDWAEVTPERLEAESSRFEGAFTEEARTALRMSHYRALVESAAGSS
jgi:hypothetical protein